MGGGFLGESNLKKLLVTVSDSNEWDLRFALVSWTGFHVHTYISISTSDQGSVSLDPACGSEIANMSEKLAQSRKRQASASLRAVASELHITGMRRSYDMSKADFSSLLKDVLAQSSTPDQRRRAEEAKAAYFETAGVSLPAIPAFLLFEAQKNWTWAQKGKATKTFGILLVWACLSWGSKSFELRWAEAQCKKSIQNVKHNTASCIFAVRS